MKGQLDTTQGLVIREVRAEDAAQIAIIYNSYIEKTIITFETDVITEKDMRERFASYGNTHPWLVAEQQGHLCGYAYAAPWRNRCAYRLVVESSIYLDSAYTGQGIGEKLYSALISSLRQADFSAVIGGIALPNPASIRLHEKLGFEKVAHFPRVGYKFNRWIDVGYWQLFL